jgi:hypothetical protein
MRQLESDFGNSSDRSRPDTGPDNRLAVTLPSVGAELDVPPQLLPFMNCPIPHFVVDASRGPLSQIDRELHEPLMRTFLSNPAEVTLATAQSGNSYVYILEPKEELSFGRAGVKVYQIEGEPPAPGGYWMDSWESDHRIPKSSYAKLAPNERASLEAKLQLQYVEDQYWARCFRFWFPEAYEQWRSNDAARGVCREPLEFNPALARALVQSALERNALKHRQLGQ